MGTPDFPVPTLEALHKVHEIVAVVTVPDKPQGRGLTLMPSPVKKKAMELGLNILQPEKLSDEKFIEELNKLNADIFCIVAFKILPKAVYSIPKIASFNIHGSLLPKFRGAAPINWAIIKGESKSGLTSFILQDKVDTGDILLKKEFEIIPLMTAGELHDALQPMAADLAIETCNLLVDGNYTPMKQDDTHATPAPKIFRDDCKINFSKSANEVINFIHGLSPYPGAYTLIEAEGEKTLKILKCKPNETILAPNEYKIENNQFLIGCGAGTIEITELQLQGKRAMNIKDFANGWRFGNSGLLNY